MVSCKWLWCVAAVPLVVVGLLVLAVFLWGSGDREASILAGQTIILLVQTIALFLTAAILAVTLWFVVKYARAAKEQAKATELTLRVNLLSRLALYITDPIKTVGDYADEGHTHDKLGPEKQDWLMIEITNEGDHKAINIWAWVDWKPGFGDVEATPSGTMQPLCKFSKFDGKEKEVWREWRLPPGESRLFYVCPPPRPSDGAAHGKLRVEWYDIARIQWRHDIIIFQGKDGTWHTNWADMPRPHLHRIDLSEMT